MHRRLRLSLILAAGVGLLAGPGLRPGRAAAIPVARDAQPVVISGSSLPRWSSRAATAVPNPTPGPLEHARDAHNGQLVIPPDAGTGVPTNEIVAAQWTGSEFVEIPVQVDERFPYLLANARSSFSMYSGTDEELTYAWDDESWKRTAGVCSAEFPPGVTSMADPVPGLDDDDEIALMATDAGPRARSDAPPLDGARPERYEVALADATDPASTRYVYLFRRDTGPGLAAADGYVHVAVDADAHEWIDRNSFPAGSPEALGVSNTGYGPNLEGTVCNPDGTQRPSTDRFPRDGVTVSTDLYSWRATGRWMVREIHIAKPGQPGVYGPDLIDRWKGRAFQSSPDSSISLVGFEDEQVNWEANSATLGWRTGPVRAIREVWGADSGTNVTKTETFWRTGFTTRYHMRVHPIPPDGIYEAWDYNRGVAVKYYNALKPEGVDIDGVNDDAGNITEAGGKPLFFDVADPTFALPTAVYNWEQVAGAADFGSLVSITEIKGPTSLEHPDAVPYYRDDACFDDGTGDDPVPRPWPGEATTDQRVHDGYAAQAGRPYAQLACTDRQGAFGSRGLHTFVTSDTDNAFTSVPVNEADIQEWQFAVPMAAPAPVGDQYEAALVAPLVPAPVWQSGSPAARAKHIRR